MNQVEAAATTNINDNPLNSAAQTDQGRAPTSASMQASKPSQAENQATIIAAKDSCDSSKLETINKPADRENNEENKSPGEEGQQQNNDSSKDDKNDSSTLSTAFTISFEDETANSKKLFGIRDSIRKFAPPKPNTIEKPRANKTDSQDNSCISIESAPGGYAKQSFHRGGTATASCRSSGRQSNSSRHSNISESAAFLIEKMLNCEQGESLSSIRMDDKAKSSSHSGRSKSGSAKKKLVVRSSDDILDDDVDYCEEKSDNGTYIVGADPESDEARKKIDELFGVVKAAEASIIAASSAKQMARPLATISRQSRPADKKPLPRERQEHINRLVTVRNSSRSSSSSRQELATSTSHKPRSGGSRHSRNASCDRASKLPSSRPRRAASQSSRQSSNKELSDGDTQSSRSSLHTENIENGNQPDGVQPANMPSMKFNRAFALRRARLGLGEPMPSNRMTSTPTSSCLSQEPDSLSMSPRRVINNSRYSQASSSGGQQQNLSRTDGGRFSLRMKNVPLSSRLSGAHGSGRALGQQGALIDSYLSKVSSNKAPLPSSSHLSQQASPTHQASPHAWATSSITMPYQSSDELEVPSPSRYRNLGLSKSAHHHHQRLARKEQQQQQGSGVDGDGEGEADADYYARFNYSLNLESENYNTSENNIRACSSTGRGTSNPGQLGALDCLVISAINSLSVKIRSSVCDLMIEHAKRLPSGNETRSIVEEILPQLAANSARAKSPTSIEEIDQSLYFDLAQTLKNLKKVEQIVDVMKLISNQIQPNSSTTGGNSGTHTTSRSSNHHRASSTLKQGQAGGTEGESNTNSESNSLSPV